MRYLALLHFSEGHSRTAIANMFKVCRISVNRWISTYLAQGLSGLDDTANPSRPATLSTVQQAKLKVFVQHQSLSEQGGRWWPRKSAILSRMNLAWRLSKRISTVCYINSASHGLLLALTTRNNLRPHKGLLETSGWQRHSDATHWSSWTELVGINRILPMTLIISPSSSCLLNHRSWIR